MTIDVQEQGASSQQRVEEGGPSLGDIVRFFRRHWLLIGGGAAVAGLVTALVVWLAVPPRFEASATLVLLPQRFKSGLEPRELPIQGYQRLLESNAVIAKTQEALRSDGVVAQDATLLLGEDMESRIFVSRSAQETALAPMIEVMAYSGSAEEAAAIANVWAATFLRQLRQFHAESLAPTLALVEEQYTKERKRLEELEAKRDETEAEYRERRERMSSEWDRRLVEFAKETEEKVGAYHTATRKAIADVASRFGIGESGGEPAGEALVDGEFSEELRRKLLQLIALRIQVAQTPQFLILEKTIGEDTLWQAMALSEAQVLDLESILKRTLLSQETNPVYEELLLRLRQTEVDLQGLDVRRREEMQEFLAVLERAQVERSTGFLKLSAERALGRDALARQRAQDLDGLEQERSTRVQQINRALDHQLALFSTLAESYNEVVVARAAQGEAQDMRLGTPAVVPTEARQRLLVKALLAAVLGGIVGFLAAVVREVQP